MKIGVVADTHSLEIPQQLIDDLKQVDLIVHAGDFCSENDFKVFSDIQKMIAVHGNMDEPSVKKRLSDKEIFKVEEVTIGLYHGRGSAEKIIDIIDYEFEGQDVDIIIFGHSHTPMNEKNGNILYFNPGSPNDNVFAPYHSYGMLDINGKNIDAKIVKVK